MTDHRRSFAQALTDPDSDIVVEALGRRCDQCHADVGQLCTNRAGFKADLAGRLIHYGRRMKP
jgi:hypothetical protein